MIHKTLDYWVIPRPLIKPAANDNVPQTTSMNFVRGMRDLQKKWCATDEQINAVLKNHDYFGQDAIQSLHKRATKLLGGELPTPNMIMVSVCLGLCNALFSFLKQLPQEEVVFILEDIARQTDATIEHLRGK